MKKNELLKHHNNKLTKNTIAVYFGSLQTFLESNKMLFLSYYGLWIFIASENVQNHNIPVIKIKEKGYHGDL